MSSFWTDVDAWITAAALMIVMLASWLGAWWWGSRFSPVDVGEAAEGKFHDAVLATLGLLLAFTFSMSLVKHEQRRQMAVTDSNAIGELYVCAGLLKEPVRGDLQALLRTYLEERLATAESQAGEEGLQRRLREFEAMHDDMQVLVRRAVDEGTPIVEPLVEKLANVSSTHTARLAALRDRLAPSVLLLLCLSALLSMALLGRQEGAARKFRPGSAVGFALLVSMVIWVTLDLNQPQQGWIRVSQEPLQQLLNSMTE